MTSAAPVAPTRRCGCCDAEVPAGHFCGICGCPESAEPSQHPQLLRPKVFGAAPSERVLLPYFASSIFPHLPQRSRLPFRLTLLFGAFGLAAAVLARVPAVGIAISAIGLPLLFVLYLRAANLDRDISRGPLVLAAVLGAALGAGWVLLTGGMVARSLNVSIGVGLAVHHILGTGVAIPAVGMLLMPAPAILIRLTRRGTRESLDGFAIGALGALVFTAAATLTRLAPQFSAGLFAHARPLPGLVVEVVMTGVIIPVTGAAAGGLVGILLWFTPGDAHHRRVRVNLALLALVVMLVHTAVGVVDLVGLPQLVMLAVHLTATTLALLALRVAIQLALLHEDKDPIRADQPLLCIECEMAVPDMAFCPACGAATRASSRTSRGLRRAIRPEPDDADTSSAPKIDLRVQAFPGYALPAATYEALPIQRPRFGWLIGRWGTGVTALAAVLAGIALALTPKIAHFMCPPDCGRPPSGAPVTVLPRFTAPGGAFSVSYPTPESAYEVTTSDNGVTARFVGGDTGVMQLFSVPANGRSARDVVLATLRSRHPDARVDYEIPNAMVGYEPGYGVLADDWPQNPSASFTRQRILIIGAVRNDLALIAYGLGPFRTFGPDSGPGLPSGANLQLAEDMGKYVNSFEWGGQGG